ncbi:MAG TPA: hypothetical protein VIO11_08955, partial [Candidatus Methanoperedens sp.]
MQKCKIILHGINKIELLLILAAVTEMLFFPAVFGASPNDACFAGGCHTSPDPQPIDRVLYDSNPHSIIECIDCHVNSTSPSDTSVKHGQFIRQLNGSRISGPLKTKYYSENFSLCYHCHSESAVVGILNYYNVSAYHVNPPVVVSRIGTNFINNLSTGFYNGNKDYPTNIHWNHLDDFGSINGGIRGLFDFDKDGTINSTDSFQSCPACHNVHGTSYPKMTKNALAISDSSDASGSFGYIGSDSYLSPGSDVFCNGCHTSGTTFKYYRNEIKVSEDCISCHVDGALKDVNKTAFGQGVHVNINITEGSGLVTNKDCWSCHYDKDMNKSHIYTCVNCHVQGVLPRAPQVTSHRPEKTNKTTCEACHDLVRFNPGNNIDGVPYPNITSHYAISPAVPTSNYCDYCHGPNASSPFQAPYRSIPSFFHNSSNASFPGDSTCRTCHTRTDVPADPLALNNSNFHNLTTEYGDVYNGTTIPNCINCHIDHDTQFASAPQPSHSTTGMDVNNCYQCHGTKVTGTKAQKLHDVRSYVTTDCVQCHAVYRNDVNTSMFGRHANINQTGGLNNVTDDDCKTCHFGSQTGDLPMIPGGANNNNTYECQDCHTPSGKGIPRPPDPALNITYFQHGINRCISCHAPDMYHVKGTVGPRGRVENPGWNLISSKDPTGC